jgi:dGTPase
VLHSAALRRLAAKTQVLSPASTADFARNRLTHSLEVAQIARSLARNCGGDPDLSEAIALAHDLGHPPFSHAGEKALNELMAGRDGFNHNAHSLRVVEYLEHPYPRFRGLNLTSATLGGLRTHVTHFDQPVAAETSPASLEARTASLADRIAYDLHDLEDAIGAGLLEDECLNLLALWKEGLGRLGFEAQPQPTHSIRRPMLDAILSTLLADAIRKSPDVTLSKECEMVLKQLEETLRARVYHHPDVARADTEGQHRIHELFSAYTRDPDLMPPRFVERIADQGSHRVICDYIAGMTDRFCQDEYKRLFEPFERV